MKDTKDLVAPQLYTKPKISLTTDAFPSIFDHKPKSFGRETSIQERHLASSCLRVKTYVAELPHFGLSLYDRGAVSQQEVHK